MREPAVALFLEVIYEHRDEQHGALDDVLPGGVEAHEVHAVAQDADYHGAYYGAGQTAHAARHAGAAEDDGRNGVHLVALAGGIEPGAGARGVEDAGDGSKEPDQHVDRKLHPADVYAGEKRGLLVVAHGIDMAAELCAVQYEPGDEAEDDDIYYLYGNDAEQLAAANIREDVVRYEYGAAVGVEPDYAAPHIHGGQGHDKGRDVGPGYHKPVHRTEDRARGQAYGYRRIDGQPVICHEAAHEAARNGYDRADREVDAANEYRHCQAAGEDDVHGYLPCYVEQVAGGEELFGDPGDDREQHEYQRKSAENAQKFPYPSQLPAEPGLFCLFHVASPFSRAA